MNKFGIILILLLTIDISIEITIDEEVMDGIYDKLLLIIQGMTVNEKGECLNLLTNKKKTFIKLFNEIITSFLNGDDLSNIFDNLINLIRLLPGLDIFKDVPILLYNCHMNDMMKIQDGFKDDNERVKIFQRMGKCIHDNSTIIQKEGSRFVFKRGIDEKIILIGKMARPILNITMT